ncbi:expressed unknown protein [Seminavis robusta]|uniref:Uncharacterized protein n=1 Tax=Seminavis robusta TaxID=568900 RepID=A0A9N8DTF7_9STRA|nr:expressed unknown protein [Seminavis robusta]|eukprot:Sro344_g122160.1 n/a (247) ;mRNA; r:19608-20348
MGLQTRKMAKKAKALNIPKAENDTHACYGYTLKQLTQIRIQSNTKECQNLTDAQLKAKSTYRRKICLNLIHKQKHDDTPYCASTKAFLQEYQYRSSVLSHLDYAPYNDNNVRNKKAVPVEQQNHLLYGVMEYLGGIDTHSNGDMLWFGITERMTESLCLLHFHLNILPMMSRTSIPQERVQSCRPTTFWNNSDSQTEFYNKEAIMVQLHRVANAVLDVQLHKMRHKLQQTRVHLLPPECLHSDDMV